MTVSTAAPQVTNTIYGSTVLLNVNPELYTFQLAERTQSELLGMDGVLFAAFDSRDTIRVDVVESSFFSVKPIARRAAALVERKFYQRPTVKVNTRLRPKDNAYMDDRFGVLETDYRHSDLDLLDELVKLDLRQVRFGGNGYNILFEGSDTAGVARKMTRVINAFYNGVYVQPPLDYRRIDTEEDSYFKWLFNRRITGNQMDRLLAYVRETVPGLDGLLPSDNDHSILGSTVNGFFPKERTANKVIAAVEQFLEQETPKKPRRRRRPTKRRIVPSQGFANALGTAAMRGEFQA